MNVLLSVAVELPFDTSKAQNEAEMKVAKVLYNHLKIDFEDEAYCYAVYEEMMQDLEAAGIDEETFNECMTSFEQRELLCDCGGGVYEFYIKDEEGELNKFGNRMMGILRRMC